MQKCGLLLETISMGEPRASAGGEGNVFVLRGSAARLVASSSDGKSARCVMRGGGRVGCSHDNLCSGELLSAVLLPLGTGSPCPCLCWACLDVSTACGPSLGPMGLLLLPVLLEEGQGTSAPGLCSFGCRWLLLGKN